MSVARLRLAEEPSLSTPEQIYQRYAKYVATLAYRLLGRNEGLDDLVQDVFLAATAAKLSELTNEHQLRGWLATVTVRLAGKILRRRRIASFIGLDDGPDEQLLAPGASQETVATAAQLYRRLDTLPSAERVAWTLRYIENEPLADVAMMCRCSLATAKRRIANAHRALSEDES